MWLPCEHGWKESRRQAKRKVESGRRCGHEWHGSFSPSIAHSGSSRHSSSRSVSRSTWESRSRSRRKRLSTHAKTNARDIIEAYEREERDNDDESIEWESHGQPNGTCRIADIKSLVKRLYERHNPAKLSDVAKMFQKYQGMEVEMYLRICKLYNVKPHPDYASVLPEQTSAKSHPTQGCSLRPVAKSAARAGLAQRLTRSTLELQEEGTGVFCSNADCGMQMCAGVNFETHPVTRQPYCHECSFYGGIYAEAAQNNALDGKDGIIDSGPPTVYSER